MQVVPTWRGMNKIRGKIFAVDKLALRLCELELLRSHPKDERGSVRGRSSGAGWTQALSPTVCEYPGVILPGPQGGVPAGV